MELHDSAAECKDAALAQFEEAIEDGPWMMAIWSMKGDMVTVRRTTSEFPNIQYRKCQELLQNEFRKELIPAVNTEPLPMASRLRIKSGEENGEDN